MQAADPNLPALVPGSGLNGDAALDPVWLQRAESLMNDQCWCWGRDVRYARGNLLVRYGLRRLPDRGPDGHTIGYRGQLPDGSGVWLRGAGMLFEPPSLRLDSASPGPGVLFGRFDMRPRVVAPSSDILERWIWEGVDAFPLARLSAPSRALEMAERALRWIADYEDWITANADPRHRARCLAAWPQRANPPFEFPQRWRDLAGALARLKRKQVPARRLPRSLPTSGRERNRRWPSVSAS